jgi:hypothetical protein
VENLSTVQQSPARAALALALTTQSECLRDRATLLAVGLLGLGTLSLHATTVFTIGGEQSMRAELARNSMLLASLAAVGFALLRHGGVEWSRTSVAPLVCSPLGRAGWFAGRALGTAGAAALLAGVVAVAAVAMEGFASGAGAPSVSAGGALVLLAVAAVVRGSRPTSVAARWCGGGGVALGVIALLLHAIMGFEGLQLARAAAGAAGAGAVLAAAGFTASLWLPVGGAVGVVLALYLLGHVAVQALAPGWATGVWRIAIPDLAGIAALEPLATLLGLVWAAAVAWIGGEGALRREL